MAARALMPGGDRAPWLRPYADWLAPLRAAGPGDRLLLLNRLAAGRSLRTASGRPLRFVDAACADDADAYEASIADTGLVPTRLEGSGALHDLYNALAWLRFPGIKARLNALQAAQIARDGIGPRRGALRDAVTLFDENALLWVCDDPEPTRALREFDWGRLFVALRARLPDTVAVWVVGHALLEKLETPYRAITAHAWPVALHRGADAGQVDAAVAAALQAAPPRAADFCPLPVFGLPGWCDDNRDPAFYDDRAVFRPGRLHARRGAGTETDDQDIHRGEP
jgi:hypothetical protein